MLTLATAKRIIQAAERKAVDIGQPMNIAVVDEGGNLKAHVRMDGAWIGSIDIAINKAWTARAFDIETQKLAKNSQSGDQFFGIHVSNRGRVMIFAGGVPLRYEGKVRWRHRRQRGHGQTGSGCGRGGREGIREGPRNHQGRPEIAASSLWVTKEYHENGISNIRRPPLKLVFVMPAEAGIHLEG